MLFDTPVYLFFLAAVVLLYWRLSHRWQNRMLVAASYFFYGWWDWRFLLLMIGSTCADFYIARAIDTAPTDRRRKILLTTSLILNFGFLGVFKYFNFFAGSVSGVLQTLGFDELTIRFVQIVLPPGISFYTFQEVAYIVDVYSRKLKPAKSWTDYALFISLFPHLIAGPIQRPSHLLPQVQNPRTYDSARFFDGLMLIFSGLFRKLVIAGQSEIVANGCFGGHFGHNAAATLMGVLAFALQIYGDFSGYSDIARGSAQLLGFHFMLNFRQPYLATSLQDFWRRWHISLSTWLRDYLYIPLGGNRRGKWNTYRNLMLTMLLGGLWHGANWTFVIWGAIHGTGLSLERLVAGADLAEPRTFLATWMRRAYTFAIVCLAWVFFRAQSVREAFGMIGDLGRTGWDPKNPAAMVVLVCLSLLVLLLDLRMEHDRSEYLWEPKPWPRRVLAGGLLILITLAFGSSNANAFIYFQF